MLNSISIISWKGKSCYISPLTEILQCFCCSKDKDHHYQHGLKRLYSIVHFYLQGYKSLPQFSVFQPIWGFSVLGHYSLSSAMGSLHMLLFLPAELFLLYVDNSITYKLTCCLLGHNHVIHLFTQQIFVELLLCTKHYSRCLNYRNKQNRETYPWGRINKDSC